VPRERDRLAAAFRSESRTHTRRCSLTCSPEHRRAAGGGGVCGGTGRRVGEGRVCPARVGSMTSSGHGVGGRCSCSRGVGRASSVACRGLTPAPVTAIQAVTGTGVDGGQVEGLAHTSDAPCLNCARDTGCSAIGLSPGTTPARPTARSLLLRPALDVRPQPKLYPPLPEIQDGTRHVVISALIEADAVAMGEAQDLGNDLSVDQVLGSHLRCHLNLV